MKQTKKSIPTLIAILFLAAGIVLAGLGIYGQSIYNGAIEIIGCKKAQVIDYIKDPEAIVPVVRGLDAAVYENYLNKKLGLDSAEVKDAVEDKVAFDAIVVASSEKTSLINYIVSSRQVSESDAAAIYKDKAQRAEISVEMEYALAEEQLGLSKEEALPLIEDTVVSSLLRKGFDGLMTGNSFTQKLFRNAIMLLFCGLVLCVAGFTYFFVRLMNDGHRKISAKAVKHNPKVEKIQNFLLNYALYIILITILLIVCIVRPNFLDVSNILNILKQASTKGILALGCAGLIVLAGTDLSIGRVLGLSAAVCASLVQSVTYASRMFPQMTAQLPLWVPLLATIAVAVLFSLFNGFGVAKLHLHAFIITLGTQLIAQGLCCIYIESQPSGTAQALSTLDQNFLNFAAGSVTIGTVKIPLVVLYFLGTALVMWVVWNKTKLGKDMFAVGGNEEAAAVSGVNVARTIILVYLVAGILYGMSAFLETARITSVGANTGLNYETDAISACVVGGVSFSGGVGTIQGVVIGAIILQAINYSLQFLGINPYLQYVIRGLIIILAVSIDVRKYIAKK